VLCDGRWDEAPTSVSVGRGALIGDAAALLAGTPQPEGAVAKSRVTGFWIRRDDLDAFLVENPGIRVRIQPWTASPTTTTTTAQGMAQMVTEHVRG
jgi:CRP-like cAMP-binding protein